MKPIIVAAGRFDADMAQKISAGREPRLDVFELQAALGNGARKLDFGDVERSRRPDVQAVRKALGFSAAVAYLAFVERGDADAFFTTGEDIGLPLAMLMKLRRVRASHTMIAHTLAPAKKRVFFRAGAGSRLDKVLCYASTEERLMLDQLGLPARAVQRFNYHADEQFFRPMPEVAEEPNLICSAGQLLRDYDTLIGATSDLPVQVRIAAGSPWIAHEMRPSGGLPANVDWKKYNRFDLRDLYARSALAVVPLHQNVYQTGISTILEMMAMGKCVIATRTHGQVDTIVDGVTGVYVPPGNAGALRAAIQRLLASPADRRRIGQAARAFIEKEAGLDLFTEKCLAAMKDAHAARFGSSA